MRMALGLLALLLGAAATAADVAAQTGGHTLVALFAHPDDERIVGPMLARYAREGRDVYLVIATDGSKGVRQHAGVPAGDSLAHVRAEEARCAARQLGIHPPILLGLEDAGLASFASLERLRDGVRRVLQDLKPEAAITFGSEGGTGHPDHRLVGDVVTEVVQTGGAGIPQTLYYASLPAERMQDAPPAQPNVTSIPQRYLSVSVSFTPEDLEATRRAFACHATQYTPAEMDAIMRYLAHGFGGAVHLKPWYEERLHQDWAYLARYREANARLGPPPAGERRVVFYGNSITEGWARYFDTMFPGKPYVGRGISGQTTPQMLVRFRQDVIGLAPAVVVILAGTNDIAGNTGPSTPAMIEDHLASMVELAQANGIHVVLSSVLPVYDYPWRPGLEPAQKIVALNEWMKRYAAEHDLVYLDYYSAMVDARGGLRSELSYDGVHPNEAGYRVMAPLAERAIAQALAGR